MSDARPKAPECERLAAELRALRERTGLSLAALGDRTPYSKSSWQRYLNGTKPLSRQAVEALCKLAKEPPGRLLALWELADAAWSGRAGGGSLRADADLRHCYRCWPRYRYRCWRRTAERARVGGAG